jgi:arginyl-tRNA synthetase
LKLCQWFVDASIKVFEGMYELLDILPFEHNLGESYYESLMKKDVEELLASGIATKEGEMVYVDLEAHKLGRCIFVKSDGASTYHLRDLSTYRHRIKKLKTDKNLYVVDSRQAHHFRQLFKVIELLGWPGLEGTKHVSYGFVTLPEGSLSTRKGRIVQAIDVINEGFKRSREVIEEKNPELKDKEAVAKEVTRAAMKFANLLANRDSDIVFEWDKVLRFDGDTGPYLQYTYARIKSVLRRANAEKGVKFDAASAAFNEQELSLLRHLCRFPEQIEIALRQNDPNNIAEFLLQLAHRFNRFYEHTPIAMEENATLRSQRLAVAQATAQVLKNGLYLLGINVVEEM